MGRLAGLDALRGSAALCVAAYHMATINGSFQPFAGGYLAVDFFFVLSGYVMTRSYEGRGIERLSFLLARVRRLWPTMALGVALGFLAQMGHPMILLFVIAGLLFLPVFVEEQAFPINSAAWSIFFELVANALHSIVLWRLSNRQLAAFLAFLTVLCALIVQRYGGLKPGPYAEAFAWGVPRALLSYCLGILLSRKWADRAPFRVPFVVTLALLPVMLTKPFYAMAPGGWFDLVFVWAACPLLIAGGLSLATTWGKYLGAISFPLYAVHYPIMTLAHEANLPPLVGLSGAAAMAVVITFLPKLAPIVKRSNPAFPGVQGSTR